MDHNYAREKLTLLLRDLDHFSADEFWLEMSRIAAGSTGKSHAEDIAKERDSLAAHVERLKPTLEDFARGQGVCCCGDDISSHTINDGHSPVDSGWYALDQYMSQAPATSLAQRDAEMQARALDEAAEHTTPAMHKMAEWLRSRARWIRKHGTETGA